MDTHFGRSLLRQWARWRKAPGWHYQTVQWFGHHACSDRSHPTRLPNGCDMRCNLSDEVQRQIYFHGVYEPVEAYLFTNLLGPGMTVVDAGANVGQYTLLAATSVGPSGTVHSFEPTPAIFRMLKDHVRRNGLCNVRLNRAAVWNETTTLSLGLSDEMADNLGAYSIGIHNSRTAVEAPAIRLDQYVSQMEIRRVDLIKMDIEGAELFALQGARRLLQEFQPLLLVEICRTTARRLGYDLGEIWRLLNGQLGYRACVIGHDNRSSVSLKDLDSIKQSNVLFYLGRQPDILGRAWDLKTAIRWSVKGWS